MPPIQKILGAGETRTNSGIILPNNALGIVIPQSSVSITTKDSTTADSKNSVNGFSAGFLARAEANKARFMAEKPWMQFLSEYIPQVEQNPKKYLRQVARYFLDAVEYWDKVCGVDSNKKIKVMGKWVHPYAFVNKPWEPKELVDKELVQDQLIFWNDLIEQIKVVSRKKHPNKMIVVHGPNATGKSLAFDTMFGMLEAYSKTDEGALYTYEWVFGNMPGDMGFHSNMPDYQKKGEAIERNDIVVSIPAGKNANPIFLLDKNERVELLKKLQVEGKIPEDLNTDYLLSSEVNDLSRRVYESLLNLYEGDVKSVLNHVHVVRWTFSAQGRKGLVLIPPNVTPNTRLVEVTPKINWDDLPRPIVNEFRNAGIHVIEGDEAEANHGVIVYDDFLKDAIQGEHVGSMDDFLHLLRFAEKGKTTISTTTTRGRGAHAVDEGFDILMFGTTNDDTLMKLDESYAEWPSLNDRLLKVAMWMARAYRPVTEIFRPQLLQLLPPKGTRHVSPNALEAFGLWVTMTYLFPAQNPNYYNSLPHIDEKIKPRLIGLLKNKLSIIEKALLYQHEDINSYRLSTDGKRYSQEEQQILESYVDDIANEYNLGVGRHKFFFYEGSVGFDVRQAEPILQRAIMAKPNECFSAIEMFDVLSEEIKHGFEFEKKRDLVIKKVSGQIAELKKANKSGSGAPTAGLELMVLPENIPPTKDLLDQVKEYEKRRIKFDVYKALDCIKSKEEQLQDLKKYVEHIMASIGKRPLRPQWRSTEGSTQPDDNFMQKMEKILCPDELKSGSPTNEFRRKIAGAIGEWTIDNKGKDAIDHLDTIDVMKDFINRMISYDIQKSEEKVKFFLQDLRTYYERGKDMKTHSLAQIEPNRVKDLYSAIDNLKEKGYCDKCITKHVFFAFPEDDKTQSPGMMI